MVIKSAIYFGPTVCVLFEADVFNTGTMLSIRTDQLE